MTTFVESASVQNPIYQNIQNNPPIKLTLCERVSQLFSRLYEKISNLFSRKKKEKIEPIYDVPQSNRTLYKRISNLFSRGPNRVELLEKKVDRENAQLHRLVDQIQQNSQNLKQYIHVRVQHLETCVRALKDAVVTKEAENNSLKETISRLEYEFNPPISRSDSGFSESPPLRKKHGLFSKAKHTLKIG